jgi:hypothetical protein
MTAMTDGTRFGTGDLELHDRAAAGRCHECGSSKVLESCSDCHQLMCDEHQGRRGPLSALAELRDRVPHGSRPATYGGNALHLCRDCARRVDLPWRALVSGTVVFAAGLLLVPWASVAGLAVAFVGAGVAGVASSAYTLRWRRLHRRLAQRLRIEPGVASISLVDLLEASAKLDDQQQYTVTPVSATGELVVDAEWSDAARTRVRQYCRRRRLPDAAKQRYWAGAIVLRGQVGFDIESESELQIFRHAMLPLYGKVGDHKFLHSVDGHERRSWRIAAQYLIKPDPDKPWTMPIWLTPSIPPGSDRRILDLDIQWAKFGPGKNGLILGSIEKLQIKVPDEWGPVLGSTNYALVSISSSREAGCRVIEWRPIPDLPHTARGRYRISLRFEGRIRPNDAIHGEMVARFRGNLCGVEHVDLHGPDGERQDGTTTKRQTRVRLEFDLSTAAVDYEALRVLPRHADPTQPDASDRPQHVFDRVVPDSATLARVMGALSDGDYYVKRVVGDQQVLGHLRSEI